MELNDEQVKRNDEIDNAVHQCLCVLTEKELEWDQELIGCTLAAIKTYLIRKGIHIRHPGIVTNEDGTQEYVE
jgi:hypothetical protein